MADDDLHEAWEDVRVPYTQRGADPARPEWPAIVPGFVWAGLLRDVPTGRPEPAGLEEVSAPRYRRIAVAFESLDSPTGQSVLFGPAEPTWGPITRLGLYDRATFGRLLYWSEWMAPLHPAAETSFEVALRVTGLPLGPQMARFREIIRFVLDHT